MQTVEEALAKIEAECYSLASKRLPLAETVGLLLAEDAASDVDSPPHDKAMMDGYAVSTNDRNPVRKVLEMVTAGGMPTQPLAPGTAVQIMTGAPVPEGADAVVMVEKTQEVEGNAVRILQQDISAEQHIMRRGASLKRGDVVLTEGTQIRPTEIGILAEVGCSNPLVVPRPSVAVIATGNELVPLDQAPTPGTIRNSNGPLLTACVDAAGGTATHFGIAPDDEKQLKATIGKALEYDVVILSGGVSAGVLDLVPPTLEALGVRQVFHKVAMKPGKPTWFGTHEKAKHKTLVIGLPGNPVSCLVCFEILVRPAIRFLAGHGFDQHLRFTARLEAELQTRTDRPVFRPIQLKTSGLGMTVSAIDWKGSADLASLAKANALLVLPAGEATLAAGETVEVLML